MINIIIIIMLTEPIFSTAKRATDQREEKEDHGISPKGRKPHLDQLAVLVDPCRYRYYIYIYVDI